MVLCTVLNLDIKSQEGNYLMFQEFVNGFSRISVNAMKLSVLTNELLYIDSGVNFNATRAQVIADIELEIEDMHILFSDLKDSANKDTSLNHYLLKSMTYWRYNGVSYQDDYTYAIDYLNQLSNTAQSLISGSFISSNDTRYLEIYKNSIGYNLMNSTLFEAIDKFNTTIDTNNQAMNWLCIGVAFLSCLGMSVFGIYPLYRLQSYRAGVWKGIFKLPRSIILSKITSINMRLVDSHQIELIDEVKSSSRPKFKYFMHGKQKVLYVVEACLVLGMIGFILYVNQHILPSRTHILKSNIQIHIWMNMKIQISYLSLFYLRESKFHFTKDEDLSTVEYLDLSSSAISSAYYIDSQVLQYDTTTQQIWDNFYDKYSSYDLGYHSLTLDLYSRLSEFTAYLRQGYEVSNQDCIELWRDIEEYIYNTEEMKGSMVDANDFKVKEYSKVTGEMSAFTIVYIAVMVGGVLMPLLSSYKDVIIREADMLAYLPKNDIKIIKRALKMFK